MSALASMPWNGPRNPDGSVAPCGSAQVGTAYTLQALPPGAWPERDAAWAKAETEQRIAALEARLAALEAKP